MDLLQNSPNWKHEQVSKLAYKYSQRFANSSSEENWHRAEKQLGNFRSNDEPVVQKLADRIKSISELVTRCLPILSGLYIIAVALGAIFLLSYLHEIGVPTPPIDTAMTVLLLFLAAIFFIFLFAAISLLFYPFIAKHMNSSLTDVYPALFYASPLANKDWYEYLQDYLKFFLPFFVSMLSAIFCIPLYLKHSANWIQGVVFLIALLVVGPIAELFYLKRLDSYKSLKSYTIAFHLWTSVVASALLGQ